MADLPRGIKDVGHIIGAELDTMTSEFSDICWEVERKRMFGTFSCDGKLYLLTVVECPDDVRAELGYPTPERVFCWHCEERIIGSLVDTGNHQHPNCSNCPTWEDGCLSQECEQCA